MAVIASDDFAGIGAANLTGRTLNNSLGGSGSRAWAVGADSSLRGNSADGVIAGTISSAQTRSWIDLTGLSPTKWRVKFNPSGTTPQLLMSALCTTSNLSTMNGLSILMLAGHTQIRIREFVAGSPTDRGTNLTITSPGTTFWLELEVSGLTVYARVLNTDTSVRNEMSYTASSLPSGTLASFGYYLGGDTGIFDDFIVDDGVAGDAEAPTFTGTITVGAKTSSTINLTLPTATDNVAVTGYEYRVDGGAWVDNGASTAVALSGLTALTSYTIDARAYDAAANVSTTLSVTTSTYRAGASAGSILAATGPQDGNPAGWLYALAGTVPSDTWLSYRILSGPTPSGGTLDAQPNGAASYTGPSPATLTIQPEINGVDAAETIDITLYDQTAVLSGGSDRLGYSDAGGALLADLALLTGGADVVGYADAGGALLADLVELTGAADVLAYADAGGALTAVVDVWPSNGVRITVPLAGPEPFPIKLVHQYDLERIVYELDFEAKFLAQVGDAAKTLAAFIVPDVLPAESRVAVGSALSSGRVMFAIGRHAPVGTHGVVVAIETTGGIVKACKLQVVVLAP